MSLAFLNFADHEAAVRAFSFLSRPSDFPEAFAPSTKVVWGAIHGLGPNLAHFIARYGIRALDPPFAPLVFEDGVCVPRSQDILWNLGDLITVLGINDQCISAWIRRMYLRIYLCSYAIIHAISYDMIYHNIPLFSDIKADGHAWICTCTCVTLPSYIHFNTFVMYSEAVCSI